MSILTGFKKVKNYILTSSGYQLLSRWTSSQTVEFDDGKTAQAKLGEINGIAKTYVDMKKATDNSMAASAKAVMEGLENSSALISMTQAEYDALSDEERTDNNMRAILDANPDVVDAKNVNFDNTDTNLTATNTQSAIIELNGKLTNVYTVLYSNYFAANVTNTVELKDNFQNYKLLLFVCNNGTAQMYAPTVYPALYIKDLYDSVKNGQYLGTYPSIATFIGSTISGSFIPVADNKFKLTTGMNGTFMILGLK